MNDITFKTDYGYFSYRVAALIIRDNKILMVKNAKHPYYYSIGGRVMSGETSEAAVLRETYEETNIQFEIDRLVFVHENFTVADFIDNKQFQEIALFYVMKPTDQVLNIKCDSYGADGGKESLHWLPIDELSNYPVYPEFFKTELKDLKNEVAHFITWDKKTFRAK